MANFVRSFEVAEGVASNINNFTLGAQNLMYFIIWFLFLCIFQGLGRRKREAEANPGLLGYGYYPYAYHPYAYHAVHVVPVVPAITEDGVAAHPNAGTSFVGPTTWGGK